MLTGGLAFGARSEAWKAVSPAWCQDVISEQFWDALARASGVVSTPSAIERVARQTSPEAARWAFEQWELRRRAAAKFSRANEMLFTRAALEMATHERVAAWRASRFPEGVLITDVSCGIGGDLMAFAGRGPAVGYELDPVSAAYARHNLALVSGEAEVHCQDGLAAPIGDYAFADPARRKGGARTLDPNQFSPDPTVVAAQFSTTRLSAVKLSPMLPDPFLESIGPGLCFVSHQGECCEAVVWCGSEAVVSRSAVHVESGAEAVARDLFEFSEEPREAVFEADPAVIRAHALGSMGSGLAHLGDSSGYLTGVAESTIWFKKYLTVWSGPYRPEKIGEALRAQNARIAVVKKRSVPVEPKDVKIKPGGDRPLTLILYPVGKKIRAVLAQPEENRNSPRES